MDPAQQAPELAQGAQWLTGEFTTALKAAFEGLTGECPSVAWTRIETLPDDVSFQWRQPFTGIPGAVWMAAAESDWTAIGDCVLRAAGLTESGPAAVRSEFLEILKQTLSGVSSALTQRVGQDVRCDRGTEEPAGAGILWASMKMIIGTSTIHLITGIEKDLLQSLPPLEIAQSAAAAATSLNVVAGQSKTFELLLDVELPVTVSFGRAQLQLKDVLKLTTGSIVELNRTIGDPVEVIVNNCVIARGEVVTVDGNFGVRIQQVISRQERLRTLN
jgi:flagellar motor switch protein FliN/FliY